MKYANPKTVLTALASRGTSVTRTEALRLLASKVPDDWPECPRHSRQSLLRRLACDKKKSARARLAALKEVLASEPQTSTAERSADHPPTTSEVMLRALGKEHIGQISEEDFARHAAEATWADRLELDRQRGEWIAPDDELLTLMGSSMLEYWTEILNRATSTNVRQHAQQKLKELEARND